MYAPVTPNQKLFKLRLFRLEYLYHILLNLQILRTETRILTVLNLSLGEEGALLSFPCGRYCRPMGLKTACGS